MNPDTDTPSDDDFHRLISHVKYGNHFCSPTCAREALADESKGIPDELTSEEVDTMMSQCWSEEADDIIADIAKVLAGLQVPVSLGMGRDGILGTAYEPWLALWDKHHIGGGWRSAEEVEQRLREKLGMPPL